MLYFILQNYESFSTTETNTIEIYTKCPNLYLFRTKKSDSEFAMPHYCVRATIVSLQIQQIYTIKKRGYDPFRIIATQNVKPYFLSFPAFCCDAPLTASTGFFCEPFSGAAPSLTTVAV